MEQFPRSSSRSSRHASDQQAPHERSRTNRQTTEPRRAAGSHRSPANKGARTDSAAKEQAPTRPKSRYIPALDGLRTLAVVAVVLYHLNLTWAQGGLLGVTIFFVLSGYLITRLLINEIAKTGRIDLKSFWIRRIRRLFPAVVTVVVVTCALCTVFNHVMLTKMRPDILPSLLFFNNWWQIMQDVSYFNALGDPSPLTHFWSLAIEEQFYLIWPPLLLAMVSVHMSKPNTRRVVLGLAAVSAVAMMVLYNPATDPSRVYYGTDTRVFSLLLGAWMAFIPDRDLAPARLVRHLGLDRLAGAGKHDKSKSDTAEAATTKPSEPARFWSSPASIDLMGGVGLVGLAAMVALTNGYTAFQYRGGTLLCSILTLMVIAACVQPQGMVARALAAEPLVWIGKRSYSIYLWHYPLLLLMNPVANINDTPWWQYILQVLLVVAVAECSYRFIETPFRKGAFGRTVSELRDGTTTPAGWMRAHVPTCAVCAVVLVVALGGLVFVPDTSALSGEGAEILNKEAKNAKPQDQRAADDTDKDDDGFPDGAYDLLMIGDSVSLRAVDAFDGVFPHSHIDAEKGRQFDAGRATFEGYIQQNLAGKIVVFALGTNGLVTDAQVDAIMADAGDQRIVVFVNTRSPQPWVGPTNQAIANAATRYKNVRVIDWYGHSANRNDLFDGDGTHLSTAGVTEYLKLIHDAVKKDLPVHPEDHVNDPQPAAVKSAAEALVNALAYKPHKLGTDK
ncbi:acyltransferase family protein [Collinsella sp. LCP19S3_H3]|uniref:acyltransferase family protein n=1 Tax=Collinsella sp. LCP19S3_H3 TaxID=3438768 RepID=UPI003F91D5C6